MEIIARETLWKGNFLRTLLIRYKDSKNKLRNWEAVERLACEGIVAIVPVTKEGEFILIRQYRPVVDSWVIEFPAGLTPIGENALDTAFRELIEETGYVSHNIEFLTQGPVSPGLSSERIAFYMAKNATPAEDNLKKRYPPDDSEDIEVIKVPIESVYDTLRQREGTGDLVDIKVFGLVELAKRQLHQS